MIIACKIEILWYTDFKPPEFTIYETISEKIIQRYFNNDNNTF